MPENKKEKSPECYKCNKDLDFRIGDMIDSFIETIKEDKLCVDSISFSTYKIGHHIPLKITIKIEKYD